MEIDALRGSDGMLALLEAFRDAGREFDLGVAVAIPVETVGGRHLLFTIGKTTAAMTVSETQWFAEQLIHQTAGMGQLSIDFARFGRMLLTVLAETPGPHGAH